MKAIVILAMAGLLICACGSGGPVHEHHIPSPTPHKVVMMR